MVAGDGRSAARDGAHALDGIKVLDLALSFLGLA